MPVAVPGVSDARKIVVGLLYACAIDARGTLDCWGLLGSSIHDQSPAPLALGGPVRDVVLGVEHACALVASGQVLCWGDNAEGQVGTGKNASTPTAVPGLADAVAIAAGEEHNCALRRDGHVACWGDNRWDQLGTGTGIQADAPAAVPGVDNVQSISADRSATCAALHDGRITCWGRLAGFGASEVHLLEPTVIPALGKAHELRVVGTRVCVEAGGAVRCAQVRAA